MDEAVYLNIGCGKQLFDGFINIDLDENADLQLDVTQGLPFDDRAVQGIYSEHFIEHINQGQGHTFMRECARVLKPGAKIRIATPDLDAIVARYDSEDWLGSGLRRHGFEWVDNPCEALNINMREWGHQWLYNETELLRLGTMAGLRCLGRQEINVSSDAMLSDRETRPESLLILEFEKPERQLAEDAEPLVSILIPSYNPRFFSQALRSAMEQSYRRLEILISDDCPTDAIQQIVEDVAAGDARVKYSRREDRGDPRKNYLRLFEMASGEFIKYLNDDDLLEADCVEQMLNAFRKTPDITLVTSNRRFVDDRGAVMDGPSDMVRFVPDDQVIKGESLASLICALKVNYIGEPTTIMFRRDDMTGIRPDAFTYGGEVLRGIGDVALATNLMGMGDVYFCGRPLSHFRQHEEQHQRQEGMLEKSLASWVKYERHVRRFGYHVSSEHMSLRWRLPEDSFWHSRTLERNVPITLEESYQEWREKHFIRETDVQVLVTRMVEQWGYQPSIHLVICAGEGDGALLANTLDSLSSQAYSAWGLTVISTGTTPDPIFDELPNLEWLQVDANPSSYLNQVADSSTTDWMVVMEAGATLEPTTLLRFADRASFFPGKFFFYCDEDVLDEGGNYHSVHFKPQFSLDLLRSSAYMGGFCMVRRELIASAGGFTELPGVSNHDMALKFFEQYGAETFVHIADVLYHKPDSELSEAEQQQLDSDSLLILNQHLQRCGIDARAMIGYEPGGFRVQYHHPSQPLVTIIIPTKNNLPLLKGCISSLLEKTEYPHYEVLVVDNGSDDATLLQYYQELGSAQDSRVRVLYYNQPFNYSAMNNLGVNEATGDYVLLLNDDTQIIQPEWLGRMMAHAQRDEVGAVGARLLHKDSTINHAGIIVGMVGSAGHPGANHPFESRDIFMGRDKLEQNFCAVMGACLLVKKSRYQEVGGLNEVELAVSYNDVDFCLRLMQAGYSNVYTPFATLIHYGSFTQIREGAADEAKIQRLIGERDYMFEKWLPLLADDPYYNENLALRYTDVVADSQLPLRWERCIHDRSRIVGLPLTDSAVGDLRVIAPLNALDNTGAVQTMCAPPMEGSATAVSHPPSLVEMARLSPDVLLLQSGTHPHQLEAVEYYRKYLKETFMVYDLEDYKFALPEGHPQFSVYPKDMRDRLQRSLNHCDRLLVSSEQLLDDYHGMIDDIRYVPNYLSRLRWEGHESKRRRGKKPRVGWAGAQQHHTDLAIIAPVVKALANEVEWVFMGMCLDELKPYVSEVHSAVSYSHYPETLAALDLDLAIAPLEQNIFNDAKSNLRLLEFGVMGWPVVCTDIAPYRFANAPVKRVNNTTEAWIEAIRERIHDLDAAHAEGDQLREWVLGNFMLEDNLQNYLNALMPD